MQLQIVICFNKTCD